MTESTTMLVPVFVQALPAGADPTEFGKRCEAEHTHHPEPRYLEAHHLIPRAFQHHWQPDDANVNSDGIWAPVTVLLCRTAHGNVHYWIERLVRAYGSLPPGPDHSDRARKAARRGEMHIGRRETEIAEQALVLFERAGGSVRGLYDAGILGGIYGKGGSDG